MKFKEIFAEHLPDTPLNVELSLQEFAGTCHKLSPPDDLKGCLKGITTHLDFLQTEDALRLSQQMQARLCAEIAVCALGMINPKVIEPMLDEVMGKLLAAKNHDYGSAYAKFGSWGIIIRSWDKVLRVINLLDLEGDNAWVPESIMDTLKDLAGYAALLYVCLRSETIKFQEGA